jgi:hypothetical protein
MSSTVPNTSNGVLNKTVLVLTLTQLVLESRGEHEADNHANVSVITKWHAPLGRKCEHIAQNLTVGCLLLKVVRKLQHGVTCTMENITLTDVADSTVRVESAK